MSSVTASTLTSATVAASSAPASCTTAVPGNYGYVPPDACNSNYNFNPQYAPAVAVAVIFGILTGVHVLLGFVFRKPYTWVMIMGAIWETLAFVLHALGAHDQQNQGMSIAYTILFLLAPLWINAFVYMTFARAVYFFSPSHKVLFVQATGMSKYFVWLDVLTFLVQAVGGSMATPGAGDASIHAGLRVYLGGVGAQQLCILLFLSLMVVFHRECLVRDATCPPDASRRSWKGLLYCLYTALALITIRICYRIAEFANGITPESNAIPYHEVYGYVLDALPMILCLTVLAVFHPARTLQGPGSELPKKTRAEKKAEKQAKKQAKKDVARQKKEAKRALKHSSHVQLVNMSADDSAGGWEGEDVHGGR